MKGKEGKDMLHIVGLKGKVEKEELHVIWTRRGGGEREEVLDLRER